VLLQALRSRIRGDHHPGSSCSRDKLGPEASLSVSSTPALLRRTVKISIPLTATRNSQYLWMDLLARRPPTHQLCRLTVPLPFVLGAGLPAN
jgi:hypothetical protein